MPRYEMPNGLRKRQYPFRRFSGYFRGGIAARLSLVLMPQPLCSAPYEHMATKKHATMTPPNPSSIMHQLDRRPRCVCLDRLRQNRAAQLLRLIRHVIDRNTRQARTTTMLLRMEDECRAPTALSARPRRRCINTTHRAIRRRRRACRPASLVSQLRQSVGEIVGMHHLIGGILELHLPAVWRTGRRADEEQFPRVGQGEVVVFVSQVGGGGGTEVDAAPLPQDGLAVPDGAYLDGGLLVEEGDDYAPEGLEGRPGVDWDCRGYELSDGLEVVWAEDVGVLEIGEDERVGRHGWLGQRRQVGEVQGES
jgi:hypothetical protein